MMPHALGCQPLHQNLNIWRLGSPLTQATAGIISLLTHICISVALNIDVHPKLTYEHRSPYRQGLHTQLCNPSCADSCKH